MPEIELQGHWSDEEAARVVRLLKSLGIGDGAGIPGDLSPPEIGGDITAFLSRQQRKLIELLRRGSEAIADVDDFGKSAECGVTYDWSAYGSTPLQKSLSHGVFKIEEGVRYQLNNNRRWTRVGESSIDSADLNIGNFDIPSRNGEFGWGMYIPVASRPSGAVRLRIALGISSDEMIAADEFYALEENLTSDVGALLAGKGVKAIADTDGDRVVNLFVRDATEITPIGWLDEANGRVSLSPGESVVYQLVALFEQNGQMVGDLEIVPVKDFQKSASLKDGALRGSRIVSDLSGLPENRQLVRDAIARCRLDGLPMDEVVIQVLSGRPDFLSSGASAFCLPEERRIWILPFAATDQIHRLSRELSDRLRRGVENGAVSADAALDVMHRLASMSPEWWLEGVIKRYVGMCLAHGSRVQSEYSSNLVARGWSYWGNSKQYLACFGEDYRCLTDPLGLPNLITMEWDLLVPSHARVGKTLVQSYTGLNL